MNQQDTQEDGAQRDRPDSGAEQAAEDSAAADETTPVDASMAEEPEATEASTAPTQARGPRSWPGLLALLISLAAAGTVAYLWSQQQVQREALGRVEALQNETRALDERFDRLGERLDTLRDADRRLDETLGFLRDDIASQRQRLQELPDRLGRLEKALEEVPGVADEARSAWLLAEAEYYLRLANAQLSLARRPAVARRALELADEKLRDAGDPGLTRVRAELADEITALKALPDPDAEGIALRLGSLARSLNELPMARQTPGSFGREAVGDDRLSGLQRAWAAVRQAFASLVRIKPTDDRVTPLRSAAEEALLLRSMETELALARLAVLRAEGQLYRDALAGVIRSLEEHFDTEAGSVRSTIEQLESLQSRELPESMPDISGSLQMLLRVTGGAGAR